MYKEELLLEFPGPRETVPPVRRWRSTWIISSLQTLRERGHFDRYRALLPALHQEAIVGCVAGEWLPLEVAHAHYSACDALHLPFEEQLEMGMASGKRAQGTVLATLARLATGVGVSPTTLVPHLPRLWSRGADGGGGIVRKQGPKEFTVDMFGCGLFVIPYFRVAFGGVIFGVVRLFARKVYVHDMTGKGAGSACTLRMQWV